MKLKTLLVSAVALLCSAASWGYTTTDLTSAGWTEVTSLANLSSGVNSNVYVLVDAGAQTFFVTKGSNISDRPKYVSLSNPFNTPDAVWILESRGTNKYAMRNLSSLYYFNSHTNGYDDFMANTWSSSGTFDYAYGSSKFSITNSSVVTGQWSPGQYVGPWDGGASVTATQDVACNKNSENAPGFKIYAISRSNYAKQYLRSATPASSKDATFLLVNPNIYQGGTETADISGWTASGTTGNSKITQNTGDTRLEAWHWLSFTAARTQEVSLLPSGWYSLTASVHNRDNTAAVLFISSTNSGELTQTIPQIAGENPDGQDKTTDQVYVTENGSLSFGIKITDGGGTWFTGDNFRLTYYGDPYPALEEAIDEAEGNTLGFEVGEYAPYMNVAALTALASAKDINEARTASYDEVVAATTALTGATWTANVAEQNAFCGGDFTQYATISGEDMPYGWNLYNGANNHSRIMGGTQGTDNPGLSATSSGKALLLKFNATYGESTGYTMPLKAGKIYKVTFKHGRWAEANPRITDVVMTDPDGTQITLAPGFQAEVDHCESDASNWFTYTGYFVSTKAGDYNFNLNKAAAGPGELEQMQIAIGDIDLRTASALELSQTGSPAYAAGTYPSVTLPRELSTTNWNTLCLPFATSVSDYAAVRELTDIDVIGDHVSITFTDVVGTLVAGKPYLVKGNGGSSISATNVAVLTTPASAPSVTEAGATVTYNGIFAPVAAIPQNAGNYIVSSNNLYLVDSEVSLKGYRGYFNVSVPASVKSLALNFDDAVVIKALEAAENEKSVIYNLAGQRLNKVQKGVNIINGKKVLVK